MLNFVFLFQAGLTSQKAVSLSDSLMKDMSAFTGFQKVGVGIGSIFLLFVIFQCISSILDGGKFQTKMLLPLGIYLLVCNFSWVSGPAIRFTSAIGGACGAKAAGAQQKTLNKISGGKECNNIFDAFMANAEKDKTEQDKEMEEEAFIEDDDVSENSAEASDPEGEAKKHKGFFGNIAQNLGIAIKNGFKWLGKRIVNFCRLSPDDKYNHVAWGLPGFIALILQWVTLAVSLAMKSIGAVMTMIIVAFGPITWSFAIFPGNQRVIGSWFIRICQFALYGPICALIDATSVSLLYQVGKALAAGGWDSVLPLMGVLVANIVALTSVPTIASMIIEGASGAVSLTSGFQHMAGALTTAGAVLGAPFAPIKGGWNLARDAASFYSNQKNIGEQGRDDSQSNALRAIADAVSPGWRKHNSTPSGQNGGPDS